MKPAVAPEDSPQGEGTQDPVEVPHGALAPDVLRAVIESFVLREGTDYGERELALEDKVMRVRRLLERGEAQILFDPTTSTVDIVTARTGRAGSR
jgi:uncharacterized protein